MVQTCRLQGVLHYSNGWQAESAESSRQALALRQRKPRRFAGRIGENFWDAVPRFLIASFPLPASNTGSLGRSTDMILNSKGSTLSNQDIGVHKKSVYKLQV